MARSIRFHFDSSICKTDIEVEEELFKKDNNDKVAPVVAVEMH